MFNKTELTNCKNLLTDVTGATKTVHILHNSEQPASVFSILESGTKNIHVIADGLFDLLMIKLSQHYTSKKQTKIESKGPRFELGDFCVKLGSVTMNQNFKGILIEVSKFSFIHVCYKDGKMAGMKMGHK